MGSGIHRFMRSLRILSERQQAELDKAILQYLEPILTENGATELLNLLTTLLIPQSDLNNDTSSVPHFLEKKWLTVTRLQRRIIDLETELNNLRSVIDTHQISSKSSLLASRDKLNWLPFAPTKTYSTKQNQSVQVVAIHPHYPTILAGCADGNIILWTLSNDTSFIPDKIIPAHARGINNISFLRRPISLGDIGSTKATVFASCSADLAIKVWDGSSYNQLRTLLGHEHTVSSLAFSQNNPSILYSVSRDKTTKIWDVTKGYCLHTFVGHSEWVRDIDVSSVESVYSLGAIKQSNTLGDFVLTCSNDQSARLSHAESGTGIALLVGHTHVVEACKFLPMQFDAILDKYLSNNESLFPGIPSSIIADKTHSSQWGYKYCITASRDKSIKLWLLPPPKIAPNRPPQPLPLNGSRAWLIASLLGHQSWARTISPHPNGRFIFSGGDDKKIIVWDLEGLNVTGSAKITRTLQGHEGFVNSISFASLLAAPDIPSDVNSLALNQAQILEEVKSRMRCLFISGGSDSCIKLWS